MEKPSITDARARLRAVEAEVAEEFEALLESNRERFRYTLQAGRVRFDSGVQALHRSYRTGLIGYIRSAPISYLLSAPLTYSLFIPLLITDIWVTLFQHICFRVYGIELVSRRDYFVFDRQRLGYLNAIEKLNCMYCSYGNGIIAYAREVAARTEQFWCPIKHARRIADMHHRQADFVDYGDAEAYHSSLGRIRARLLD